MKPARLPAVVIYMVSLCSPFVTLAQKQEAKTCAVAFTEPKQGDSVPGQRKAKGTATVPPGKHLWILTHMQGLALWWPQCGGPVLVEKDEWKCLVQYGKDQDRGEFDVVAVVPREEGEEEMQKAIKEYQEVAKNRGDYPGMDLPQPVEGCEIAKVTVKRK